MTNNNQNQIKFSIGYNQQPDFIDKILIPFKKHLQEIYFPINNKIAGSGRIKEQNRNYKNEIKNLINKCNELNIETNLLLNSILESELAFQNRQEYFKKLIEEIKPLYNIGLSSITITNPIYIKIIKQKLPKLKIQTSINSFIDSKEKAKYYKNLGADILILDRDINFNLKLIKEIKKDTKLPIKLLLNEGCLYKCPYRTFHFIEIGKQVDTQIYTNYCLSEINKNPNQLVKSQFIIPENLKYYKDIINYYKLGSRSFDTKRITKLLNAYINQNFQGNIYEILTTYPNRENKYRVENKKLKYKTTNDKIELIDFDIKKQHQINNLIFELNSVCNNNCKYCYIPNKNRNIQNNHNETKEFFTKKIIEYKNKNIKNIDFTGGEPTLFPFLSHLINKAKIQGFKSRTLVTNGRTLSIQKYIEKLKQAGLTKVIISLDGHTQALNDNITQSKGSFNQIMQAFENLRNQNIPFGITIVINKLNHKHIDEIIKLAKQQNPEHINIQFLLPYVEDKQVVCKKLDSEIIPKYENAIPYLKQSLDKKHNIPIKIHFIPFCLMQGYESFIEKENIKYDRHVINHKNYEYNMEEHLLKGSTKIKKCKTCQYNNKCRGFFLNYKKEFGIKK